MKKNLLLLHLESISWTIIWQYRVELATIWALMNEGKRYTRFHSTATSTTMAYIALAFGHAEFSDYSSHYESREPHPEGLSVSFWRILLKYGYLFRFVNLDTIFHKKADRGMIATVNSHDALFQYVRSAVTKAIAEKKPFALGVKDLSSHMAADTVYKASAATFSERFRRAYQSIDATVKKILGILVELNVFNDTVIVGYGDHGDELWCHDLNRGFCHGTPPYASLTWTPMFMYEAGGQAATSTELKSIIDLPAMILKRLLPTKDDVLYKSSLNRLTGKDGERELVFSQNLYALQLEYDDLEKALTKGYSVCDEAYRVVVTSGGNRTRNGGMEFFCDRLDPFNGRNLLDFFTLDIRGEPVAFNPPAEATSREFSLIFNSESVEELMRRYSFLRRELHTYIREKEALAMKRKTNGEPIHIMPEKVFNYSRKRLRRD